MVKRNPGGRKKIEIKRIRAEEARQVCFSKRRMGVFKKACELCVLCGAEVVVVVYSPAGRAYSLGVPDVGVVIDNFLSPATGAPSRDSRRYTCGTSYAASRTPRGEDPCELQRTLEAEKRGRAALERALEAAGGGAADTSGMRLEELEAMESALRGLMAEVAVQTTEMIAELAAPWGEEATALCARTFLDDVDGCTSGPHSRRFF